MDKISQKVTKDPRRVEAAREGREKCMNKSKENILNNAKKGSEDTSNGSNKTARTASTLMSMALVYLLSLPYAACVFFTYNKKAGQVIDEEPIKTKKTSYALDLMMKKPYTSNK